MIFITLGTQAKDFSRLMKMAEDLVREYGLKDVIAQTGHTQYIPQNVKCIPFVPVDQYEEYVSNADVIIAHAGTGALFSSIKKGKKVIAVPRYAKFGEHVSDHQLEIARALEKQRCIVNVEDIGQLENAVRTIDQMELKPYRSGNDSIIRLLRDFIGD